MKSLGGMKKQARTNEPSCTKCDTTHLSRPVQREVDILDLDPNCISEVLKKSFYTWRIHHSKALLKFEARAMA